MIERAVVVGCGVAGLAAAAALTPVAKSVVVVERDTLSDGPTPRRGVAQGEQLHNLLTRAQVHLEELFPGFGAALRQAGGGDASVAAETHVFELGQRMPERDLGLRLLSASRPTIDHTLMTLLRRAAPGNLTINDRSFCRGITVREGAVTGVRVRSGSATETLAADVVVDASGSSASSMTWLSNQGVEPPPVETTQTDQWYASSIWQRPPARIAEPTFWLVFPTPPRTRGGLISPVGSDRWYVSMSGRTADVPPRSAEEVLAYASTLEDPWIATELEHAAALTMPNLYRRVVATWRRFDRCSVPISGLLPIGDALATLNPLFGQGLSIAAWQATKLRDLAANGQPVEELTFSYNIGASECVEWAWTLGDVVSSVLFERGADGAVDDSTTALGRAIVANPDLHRDYVAIWHLLQPATMLSDERFRVAIRNHEATGGDDVHCHDSS